MLILLRHGRTTANHRGLLQGRVDNPLDELGRAQAAAAAAAIGHVDRVVASPLARAQQTADAFGRRIETDDRFMELNYGDWDELPVRDVRPETWREWRSDVDFRPPGGETLKELGDRVRAGLDALLESASGETIVMVSHVSPMKAGVAWALGVDDTVTWRMRVAQAAICRIDISGPQPSLSSFNEVAHLAGLDG